MAVLEIQSTLRDHELRLLRLEKLSLPKVDNTDYQKEPEKRTAQKSVEVLSGYVSNFFSTEKGNSIKKGSKLRIAVPDASWISGAIYKDGALILPIKPSKYSPNEAVIILKRKMSIFKKRSVLETGTYLLKLRYGGKRFTSYYNGVDDVFEIVP